MNKRPVWYLQTDPKWSKLPYHVKGENSTIGGSGCGPSCAAMLITTLTGKKFTPEDACEWSVKHGYKALNHGTYYSYFEPQFKAFGIDCKMLNWEKTYGKPDHPNHDIVAQKLKEGYYAIALMKKGLWTSGGHFVVLWWQDGKVRINDPASRKDARLNGDIRRFRSEVQYYWLIDAREYNEGGDDMITEEQFKELFASMRKGLQDNDCGDWSKEAREWAVKTGIVKGGDPLPDGSPNYMWQDVLTREQLVMTLYRFAKAVGIA